ISLAQRPNRPGPNRGDQKRGGQKRPGQPRQQHHAGDWLRKYKDVLPQEQQNRILQRMETWEHHTPRQKQEARGLFQQMRSLPPERRQMMENAIRGLRGMPPAQRQEVLQSPRYKSMFSPEEQQMLEGITQLPLASATPPGEGGEEQR